AESLELLRAGGDAKSHAEDTFLTPVALRRTESGEGVFLVGSGRGSSRLRLAEALAVQRHDQRRGGLLLRSVPILLGCHGCSLGGRRALLPSRFDTPQLARARCCGRVQARGESADLVPQVGLERRAHALRVEALRRAFGPASLVEVD